ncbi:unnamed protein product [Adineta steineri]|uniref:Death domain-containing protein n=1 Tax=Adineta steineri TaxID=433720 RepID=A0A819JJB0_9BILA|nr:unnamed protein product [Adineta steineri]
MDKYIDNHDTSFLNLDRCLRQPYVIENIPNIESIGTILLIDNYLIQMPVFVADYINLIELNVSHNELNNAEFILYKPLNDNELTQSYWDEKLKTTTAGRTKSSINLSNKPIARPLIHPFLQKINLSFNHIKSLPIHIHYLRFLHTLDLSNNYLEILPDNFGYLEQLHTLILNNNYLKTLPNTFIHLIHLETLNLSSNDFQAIDIIKNFENLKYFSINSNPLTTFPILLYTCSNLQDISLSNTNLKDITLDYFTQFSQLKKLDLSKNNLTNNFLLNLNKSFDYLEELYLQSNQFTNIFALISYMTSLQLLDLSSNLLQTIPQCSSSSKLEILRLSYNNIELCSNDCIYLKHIIELDLDHNQIQYIPNEFLCCIKLQSLNLSFNQFRKFPQTILQLRSLNKLILNNLYLEDLRSINLLEKYFYRTLNILDLSHNNFNQNLHELTVLKALTYLDLSYNQLNELDRDFKLMTCLKILKLNQNKFKIFPICLYQMDNYGNEKYISETLLELYINDNQIEYIPDEIVHMINLQTIDLSNNKFSTFPEAIIYLEQLSCLIYSQKHGIHIDKLSDDIIHLYNLKKLDLSHNIFYEIPQTIYSLTKLEYLDMSFNLITALENKRLKQLKNLKTIKLNGNCFTSFSSVLYQIESFDINENSLCLAPPNDFTEEKSLSAISNLFVQINDQHEDELFQIYKQIFIENLNNYDIERLLIRLKLSDNDINHFRKNYSHYKREEKIEILLHIWKQKRDSLANSETLYKLAQLMGDKNLIQQIQKTYLYARKIRI